METSNTGNEKHSSREPARNEPCPCGSGKKYKRCHGMDAAPKLTQPKAPALGEGMGGLAGGFDPSQMDPQLMMQMSQMLQRLPKGQLQKLQGLMQRAMAGKDITREAEEFERSLPEDFKEMMRGFQLPAVDAGTNPAEILSANPEAEREESIGQMTEERAREIVEQALAEGKINEEQARALLGSHLTSTTEATPVISSAEAPSALTTSAEATAEEGNPADAEKDDSGLGRLWNKVRGK